SRKTGFTAAATDTSNDFTPLPVVNVPTGLELEKSPEPATTWKWYVVSARTSRRATTVGPPGRARLTIDVAERTVGGEPSASQKRTSTADGGSTRNATSARFGRSASTPRTSIDGPRSKSRNGRGTSNVPCIPSG